jgi:hypothetical protein
MKFFVGFKIKELSEEENGLSFYVYHYIITISTPLNYFGPKLEDAIIVILFKIWTENVKGTYLEEVCMFGFVHWLERKYLCLI